MSAGEFQGYDLALGSVHGVRQWAVDPLGRLTGLSYKSVWRPGENAAECRRRGRTEACIKHECGIHSRPDYSSGEVTFGAYRISASGWFGETYCMEPQPCGGIDPECGCGFWAYYDDAQWSDDQSVIRGVIKGYGKTTIGTKGFRCEKAKIAALCLPTRKPITKVNWLNIATAAWCLVWMTIDLSQHKWWWASAQAALVAFNLGWVAYIRHSSTFKGISKDVAAKIRANYPDVAIFNDYDAMLKAFPLEKAEKPTPQTDPEFWDRPAGEVLPPASLRANGGLIS